MSDLNYLLYSYHYMNAQSGLNPKILFLLFLFCILFSSAQEKDSSLILYQQGTEAFKLRKYKSADSLFSLSIKLFPHSDTYFSRAACRQKLGNRKGFCQDLGKVIALGDKEAASAFCKSCGSVDSSYLTRTGNTTTRNKHFYLEVKYKSTLTDSICVYYDYTKQLYPEFNLKNERENSIKNNFSTDTNLYTIVDVDPSFSEDNSSFTKFLKNNIRVPEVVALSGISRKSVIRFIINEDGSISTPEIITKAIDCGECDYAAINLIKSMPKWIPAKVSGKPVKTYYNLPISFSVQ